MTSDQNRVSRAQAPSNIAIVKYMGKEDREYNLPANSSLSMTLSDLGTWVELEELDPSAEFSLEWDPTPPGGVDTKVQSKLVTPDLPPSGVERLQAFAKRALQAFRDETTLAQLGHRPVGRCRLRSANTFPAGVGIASSASSFAALTLALADLQAEDRAGFQKDFTSRRTSLLRALARVSRLGSGSSCRSFEGPFVVWTKHQALQIPSVFTDLADVVFLISSQEKAVSSSEAHRRVLTSPQWLGRPERAEMRAVHLKRALERNDFEGLARISQEDFLDMHELFVTSRESFRYIEPWSSRVLLELDGLKAEFSKEEGSGFPFAVTMDAGPNVHVILPNKHVAQLLDWAKKTFPQIPCLIDQMGTGAKLLVTESKT